MTTERRTSSSNTTPLVRLRELDALAMGTVIMASSSPVPRYFRRVAGGWAACDAYGCTALQAILHAELDGWPEVLPSHDIRRPAMIVARAGELPDVLPFRLEGVAS